MLLLGSRDRGVSRNTRARDDPGHSHRLRAEPLLTVWWQKIRRDPRFHAPILITAILAIGDASYGILENHPAPPWLVAWSGGRVLEYNPTFVTMAITLLTELAVGRFFWGKWPHLASAYISGISVGILMKSSVLWPFLLCGMISIVSKYVLRIGDRHLWNPTNFGMTVMLFLASQHSASLMVQAGNNGWAVATIWVLGGLIMYKLGRFHIPLAFVAAFVPLAFLRSFVTGHPWQTELAPVTSPMFQLYIFFMITDPKTTVRGRRNQIIVAVLVAVAETVFRLAFKDKYSLYHALFFVGPIANLVEIGARNRLRAAGDGTKSNTSNRCRRNGTDSGCRGAGSSELTSKSAGVTDRLSGVEPVSGFSLLGSPPARQP